MAPFNGPADHFNGQPYREWTVHFEDTVIGDRTQRGGRRILIGRNDEIWFTRNYYGDWRNIPGRDFYKIWWRKGS